MPIDARKAARLKTAIAEETGNIQGMAQRYLKESDGYLSARIPSMGMHDETEGVDPVHIRYSTAPVVDSEYTDLYASGMGVEEMEFRGENGAPTYQPGVTNNRGSCDFPVEKISAGYDEFTTDITAKAWETHPFCVLDLMRKGPGHAEAYIDMLRNKLPMRGVEQFEFELGRRIQEISHYNVSAVDGFVYGRGRFPAIPTGGLDVGYFNRIFQILRAQGWMGEAEVGPVSIQAFESMRENYQRSRGITRESEIGSNDTEFNERGQRVINWSNINWVITDTPNKVYTVANPDGGYSLRKVYPTRPEEGSGGGWTSTVNEDYFNGYIYIDGQRQELYEISYFVHPTASMVKPFAVSQIADKSYDNQLFNFQVNLIDGPYIENNQSNLKGKFHLMHAFEFGSYNPELQGCILYRSTPDRIEVNNLPVENIVTENLVDITREEANRPRHSEGSLADLDDTPLDPRSYLDPLPTEENPDPENTQGFITLNNGGETGVIPGSKVSITVQRLGGTEGAATVDYEIANNGQVNNPGYTSDALTGTLSWEDGDNDDKVVIIDINDDATAAVSFTFNLINATGATLASDVTDITGFSDITVTVSDESVSFEEFEEI